MGAEVTVTSENFETEVLKSDVPVLVDFWAEWCMPCRMVAPVLHEIAEEYNGKVKVVKLNVDQEPEIASQYNIISIPTIMLFKNGDVVNQKIGAAPKPALEDLFKNYL